MKHLTHLVVVVPLYNEGGQLGSNLPIILQKVREAVPGARVDLVAVDDGSRDRTRAALQELAQREPALQFVSFTRNFGKEAAIHAGLQLALARTQAQACVVIDSDLQHPPELVGRMAALWSEGHLVVEAVKRERGEESAARRFAARLFYGTFSRFSGLRLEQDTDFKLLDRRVVERVLQMGERARFFRGIVRWLGFDTARVEFDVAPRAGGSTGWGLAALARYAWGNLTSFSSAPLGLVTAFGGVGLTVGAVLALKAIVDKLDGRALTGFSTVILLLILFSSMILLSLGIIGSYIARIYDELKGRPHFVIRPDDLLRPEDRAS